MTLLCLGLSHHTAPVELRERLHVPANALNVAHAPRAILDEWALLSTCNRLEVYAVARTPDFDALIGLIESIGDVPRGNFAARLYRHADADAALHLCRVAAGLDSMILGEPQILGQVNRAYETALNRGSAGPILSALFRAAIHAGKRARAETAIGRNPASISSVAVKLAQRVVDDWAAAQVLIVGAGEMAELSVAALRSRGVRMENVHIANRTPERAAQLARCWGAGALSLDRLPEALANADIVIASSGAPGVIASDVVRAAMAQRPDRPLVLIDIAVPRNVEVGVSDLPNVYRYDIDDLQAHLDAAAAGREREVPRVEAIVVEEVEAFMRWLRGREVAPVIAGLRAKADAIRRAELDRTLRYLPHLGQTERQHIEMLAESLVNKLLHDPTLRLKAEAGRGRTAEVAAAARHLFALDE
jgi:glutamyl-tRNA reductase